ncbi:MAG TPA: hypothetical protein VFX94_01140 [Burkholderiales bacterium]|nr:hypothetical protein [Burkholderiales bacterium]
MTTSRGNAHWVRAMIRNQYVDQFVALGSLYAAGYEANEEEAIREELAELGIPVGGRMHSAPRQLEPHELVARDDGAPEEELANIERDIPSAARWHGWHW